LAAHIFAKKTWYKTIDKKTWHVIMMPRKLGEEKSMNKEEILEKSREAKSDEGSQYAQNKGRRIGVAAMMILFIILILYNLFMGIDNNAIFALFWTYLGFESYGKYRFTKGKAELVGAIAGMIAGAGFLAGYLISTLV